MLSRHENLMDLAKKLQGRSVLTFFFRFCTISNWVASDSKEIGNSLVTGLFPIFAHAMSALKQSKPYSTEQLQKRH